MGEGSSTARTSGRLPLLDGLRGLAAIGVLLYHCGVTLGPQGVFSRGYLFVDFFFLLSGFVLALAIEPRLASGWPASAFLRSRVRRLWPSIAAGVALGAVLHLTRGETDALPTTLVLGLLVLPWTRSPGQIFPLNGPQWSLLLELIANLAHGLLLRRLGERGLVAVVVLAGAAQTAVVWHFGSNTLGPLAFNWWFALSRVMFSYSLGVLLCRRWQGLPRRPRLSWNAALVLPPLVVMLLSGLPLPVWIGDSLFVLLVMPALFWLASQAVVPSAVVPALDRLGRLSFPLYAVHMPILEHAAKVAPGGGMPVKLAAIAAALLAALALDRALNPAPRLPRSKAPALGAA